jgi:hypothetical protein
MDHVQIEYTRPRTSPRGRPRQRRQLQSPNRFARALLHCRRA